MVASSTWDADRMIRAGKAEPNLIPCTLTLTTGNVVVTLTLSQTIAPIFPEQGTLPSPECPTHPGGGQVEGCCQLKLVHGREGSCPVLSCPSCTARGWGALWQATPWCHMQKNAADRTLGFALLWEISYFQVVKPMANKTLHHVAKGQKHKNLALPLGFTPQKWRKVPIWRTDVSPAV